MMFEQTFKNIDDVETPAQKRDSDAYGAPEKDGAVAEAKHCIDRLLSRLS